MRTSRPWYVTMSRAEAIAAIHGAMEPRERWWKNFASCWRMIGIFAVARRWTEFCVAWSDIGWEMDRPRREARFAKLNSRIARDSR